jgi:hypothetical protein
MFNLTKKGYCSESFELDYEYIFKCQQVAFYSKRESMHSMQIIRWCQSLILVKHCCASYLRTDGNILDATTIKFRFAPFIKYFTKNEDCSTIPNPEDGCPPTCLVKNPNTDEFTLEINIINIANNGLIGLVEENPMKELESLLEG